MIFHKINLEGAYKINIEKHEDSRGFFARSFCKDEFIKMGLQFNIMQSNTSFSLEKGTLRGIHYQALPYQEAKLVSCIKGRIYDVILDLRPDSPTYCHWHSVELDANDYSMIYVPKGFGHGFQTLRNKSVVFYQVFEFYHPESGSGVRWNDPTFNINWPLPVTNITGRDKSYPNFIK